MHFDISVLLPYEKSNSPMDPPFLHTDQENSCASTYLIKVGVATLYSKSKM